MLHPIGNELQPICPDSVMSLAAGLGCRGRLGLSRGRLPACAPSTTHAQTHRDEELAIRTIHDTPLGAIAAVGRHRGAEAVRSRGAEQEAHRGRALGHHGGCDSGLVIRWWVCVGSPAEREQSANKASSSAGV